MIKNHIDWERLLGMQPTDADLMAAAEEGLATKIQIRYEE